MGRVQRLTQSVENRLTLELGLAAARGTADPHGDARVLSRALGVAQVDLVGQCDVGKAVRLGYRLVVIDVVQLAGGKESRELGGVGPDVSFGCGGEQRLGKAGPV